MNRIFYIFFFLITVSVHAEIYKWTDEDGKTHFGDKPPADVESSIIEVKINTYESPDIEAFKNIFNKSDKVVMYSASWCGVCKKAKTYFKSNNVKYSEYDVETSSKGKRDFKRMGGRGVPIILVGDKRLNGFSKAKFESIYNK